ncbi:DinB family protein [Pseudalkalibacillus caeni]|uniref:DUF664 domain-containing protein n=1 Tax=Exobacillus caeni TaxID=2574798 RepID=A0A5R9F403_9BACL|nr:DinB family protein [Pseudalkalibacillus caeni]TLS37120.1 DUF664 domain-containing protein [Pseudalkalibacillus caeni]
MVEMFRYNWQVREEWFEWCKEIPGEELVKQRTGGSGSILKTLFHVADCEQIWINQMQGTPVIVKDVQRISSLEEVMAFSTETKSQTEEFLRSWNEEMEEKTFQMKRRNGGSYTFTYGKIMRHIITHEIHHIGQLSVWAREIDKKPVSSDLIFKEF